ncbi:SDR family oxidoreductase [Kitasatospora purpeofusca]|uniref:SDR family oxidoreductase n=1 Tax=Kitasatospora purpeofusca TaxID=67352 RepID=UPI0036E405E3
MVRTPGTEAYFAAGPGFAELVAHSTPLGQPGLGTEVAEAAAWLLNDRASYVAGVTLLVDGGITATRRFG